MRFVHLLIPAACLMAGRAFAAPLNMHAARAPLPSSNLGTVFFCTGNDFDGDCAQEQTEPFGTCFTLPDPQHKNVNSFATPPCSSCELFADYDCTQGISFIAEDTSVGNGGAGSDFGPSGVGFFGGQLSSFSCSSTC